METILLQGDSKDDLNLLLKLAKKLGIKASVISQQTAEDLAMINAIKTGKTGENIDPTSFIEGLN